MMLFSLFYGLVFQALLLAEAKPIIQNPILLYTKTVDQNCAVFEVFDHGENIQFYREVVSRRDEAAFYYSDEDKQEVIIQKKDEKGEYRLKYVFIAHKKTYEIFLKSCAEHLVENKKELYALQQKLINKQNL